MRALFRIALVASLLVWCGFAQRGGGHGGGGGGFHGGGGGAGGHAGMGGGGFAGGRSIGGNSGGFRGGGNFGYNRGGLGGFNRGYGYGYGRGYGYGWGGYYGGWGYPYYGWGLGWPGYYGYDYPYDSGYGYYPDAYSYNSSPNVTVVYPQAAAGPPATYASAYASPARSVIQSYDQYGQETHSTANGEPASPIYLIAMNDGVIRAAASYSVEGGTLRYVTLQHEEKTVPIGSIDRTLTNQLNRERHVNLNLGR
jgi:hypothetical protein